MHQNVLGCMSGMLGAWLGHRARQEEAGEAMGASWCIQVILEVVGQWWASRDTSGSVGLAWGHMMRQGGMDGLGAHCVGQQHVVQGPGVLEGRAGVLRHVMSGCGGGRQGGPCPGRRLHVGDSARGCGTSGQCWGACGRGLWRTWVRVVAAEG